MSSPPNNEYRKPYDDAKVLTADGVEITDGLRVFTNNLEAGRISLAEATYRWYESEDRYVLWFDVICDASGDSIPQSHDRVSTIHPFDRTPA